MLRQVSIAESVGKTILAAEICCEDGLIVFTDGTFLQLVATDSYGTPDLEVCGQLGMRDMTCWHIDMGVVTQAEVDQQSSADEEARKSLQVAHERRQYELLKAKFAGEQ